MKGIFKRGQEMGKNTLKITVDSGCTVRGNDICETGYVN